MNSKEKEIALASIISRHPFPVMGNAEAGLAMLQEDVERRLEKAETNGALLGDVLGTTLRIAGGRSLLDPQASIFPTWDAWVTAMQVGSAVFATATTTEDHVVCRIAHKDRTFPATGGHRHVNPGTWLTAFYLAAACRERERLTALSKVPIPLLRENGSAFPEYYYIWIDTLQTYWQGGSGLGDKLVAAINATDPETVADPVPVQHLIYPPMEMLHRILRDDREGFGRALTNAVEWHKRYWSEESRETQLAGAVAIAPLAMACFAHDAGFPIEVESEYLPKALIGRNWCGEFPT
ncbi:immunity 49 family protein [Kitasatospora sp. NPDC001660]